MDDKRLALLGGDAVGRKANLDLRFIPLTYF